MGKKLDNARNFFRTLKKGDPAPVYFIWGEETMMLDEAVTAIIKHAAPQGPNDFNFDSFHGRQASIDAVVSACEMLPMMAKQRIVLMRDSQEVPLSELDRLSSYLDNPSPSTCLIIHAQTSKTKFDGRKSVVKKLKKVSVSCEFASLYENEVAEILDSRAGRRGLRLSPAVSAYLVAAVGTDLATLDQALDKIDLYIGPDASDPKAMRFVDEAVVHEVVADTKIRSVFELTDAVGERKFEEALHIVANMLRNGESAIGSVAMLARHFRIVARLQDPAVRNLSSNQKAGAVRVSPYFLKDYERHARTFGLRAIENIRAQLLGVDRALKSSSLDDKTLLEQLIYDICFREAVA